MTSPPRHSRPPRRRRGVLAVLAMLAVTALTIRTVALTGHHGGTPDPGTPSNPSSSVPSQPGGADTGGGLAPPQQDPANSNPNWIPCKTALGYGAISDYQLTDQQETQIIACTLTHH